MTEIMTKLEAVEQFGNEAQKEHFKKYKKFTNKNVEIALIKTMKQHYESVESVRQGRAFVYKLSAKRTEIAEREDARENNGEGQLPYKEDIREAILFHLENSSELTTTYRYLLHKLGIVDDILHIASKIYTFEDRKRFYDNLDEKYKEQEFHMFWEVVDLEHRRLIDNLKSTLKDMAKHKVIRMLDVVNAVYTDEKGRDYHEPLHVREARDIDDKKRELREKYNIKQSDLMYKSRQKRDAINAYEKDEKEYLDSLGIKYVYNAVHLNIIATKRELSEYTEKVLSKAIKQKHLQHAYEKAKERQDEHNGNQLIELLGGKSKPKEILDSPTIQQMIALEKQDRTYASGYKSALEVINSVNLNKKIHQLSANN